GNKDKNDLSVEDVYERSLQASEDMTSMKTTIDKKHILTPQEGSGPITTNADITAEITLDPFSSKLEGTSGMYVDDLDGERKYMPDVNMEAYVTDEMTYLKRDDNGGGWSELDGHSME